MKNNFKKLFVGSLTAFMVAGTVTPVYAGREVVTVSDDTVEKISTPEAGQREVDGFLQDRQTGYLWALAERGDYLYIGTWRDTIAAVINAYVVPLTGGAIPEEIVWDLTDVVTNGEIPHPSDSEVGAGPANGGVILKINKQNPEDYEVVYESADPFRHVALYEDDLYFATYTAATHNDASIVKVDENDEVSVVYSTKQGASVRANAVFQDHLYFAGTYADAPQQTGEPVALAVLQKHDLDDGWDLVADADDFGEYAYDPYVGAVAGSPVWDMVAYHDELYITLPGMHGFILFKGHPAQDGETANKYGWVWTEVAGLHNGVNYPGLSEYENGYDLIGTYGYLSVISALGVYNDQLYVYDIDHTIIAEVMGIGGALAVLSDPLNQKPSTYLEPVVSTLRHPQSLWVMNEDGSFEEVQGFADLMEGTTNEYVWKHGVYKGEFYISTMDSRTIYNYLTRLTNGDFLTMSEEEWIEQFSYIKKLIEDLQKMLGDEGDALLEPLNAQVDKLAAMKEDLDELDLTDRTEITAFEETYGSIDTDIDISVQSFEKGLSESVVTTMQAPSFTQSQPNSITDIKEPIDRIIELISKGNLTEEEIEELEELITQVITEIADFAKGLYDNFDQEGLDMYLELNEYVMNDVGGFDIVKLNKDGEWEVVTDDGFGDKYNYGGLRFASTDEGLFITTANPFYGGQLYQLTNDLEDVEEKVITVTPETAEWTKGSAEGLSFTTNADSTWVTVRLNGKHIPHEGYSIEDGVVTFDASLLEKYAVGTYVFTLVTEEGSVDVTITIVEKEDDTPEPKPEDPKKDDDSKKDDSKPSKGADTADSSNAYGYGFTLLLASVVAYFLIKKRRNA